MWLDAPSWIANPTATAASVRVRDVAAQTTPAFVCCVHPINCIQAVSSAAHAAADRATTTDEHGIHTAGRGDCDWGVGG